MGADIAHESDEAVVCLGEQQRLVEQAVEQLKWKCATWLAHSTMHADPLPRTRKYLLAHTCIEFRIGVEAARRCLGQAYVGIDFKFEHFNA